MNAHHPSIQNVFLVDDDPDDCDLFEEALHLIDPSISFRCSHNCDRVYEYMRDLPPDLLFLDINIPRVNGFECLREIQDHAATRRVPVVMYSSSGSRREVNAA